MGQSARWQNVTAKLPQTVIQAFFPVPLVRSMPLCEQTHVRPANRDNQVRMPRYAGITSGAGVSYCSGRHCTLAMTSNTVAVICTISLTCILHTDRCTEQNTKNERVI